MSFGKVTVLLSVLVAGLVWQSEVLSSPNRSDEKVSSFVHKSAWASWNRHGPIVAGSQAQSTQLACRFRCRRRCVRPCYTAPDPCMALAEEKAVLRWKFRVNKPFFQVITTKTTRNMKIMEMVVEQRQEQILFLRWNPEGLDDRGIWLLGLKIIGVKMDNDIDGNKIAVGDQFKFHVRPDMTIQEYDGAKEVFQNAFVRKLVDPLFTPLPTKAVRKGNTWTRKDVLDLGEMGTYFSANQYTYEGMEDQFDRIKVESAVTYTAPKHKGKRPFTIMSGSKLETNAKRLLGVIKFDCHKGRIVSAFLPQRLEGTLMIDISGFVTTVELMQEQETSMKITDTNPLNNE